MPAKLAQRRPTRAPTAAAPAKSRSSPPPDARLAYSLPEAAALLGVSFGHVRNEVRRGKLVSFRSGHRLLVSKAALERYVGIAN